MLGDDPPYLEVGTEVSAKYKGAFCEAKVRKVVKQVKAKVSLKYNMGTVVVTDECVRGKLATGEVVEVKHPDKGQYFQGTITRLQDSSQYTVVFDDGDIMTMRRTSLCLKSGRHFTESESLDHLPLTHPEHFSNPVRQRRRAAGEHRSDDSCSSTSCSEEEDVCQENDVGCRRSSDVHTLTVNSAGVPGSNLEAEFCGGQVTRGKRRGVKVSDWSAMVGKVVSVEVDGGRRKRDNWFPALVVVPSNSIDARRDFLVRSFQDGRYYTVPKKETTLFRRDTMSKNNYNLKAAIEKVILYLDKDELPPHWDRDSLFGTTDTAHISTASDSDSEDEESREAKDHFVASLYKFMDDRGTPINRAPTFGSRHLDLHKLWKVVQRRGGYNRVSSQNVWRTVGVKLLRRSGSLSASPVNTNSVKGAYKRYLLHFEEFQRKLGCSLVSDPRAAKSRSSLGSGRSLIRERDRAPSGASPVPSPTPTSPLDPAETPEAGTVAILKRRISRQRRSSTSSVSSVTSGKQQLQPRRAGEGVAPGRPPGPAQQKPGRQISGGRAAKLSDVSNSKAAKPVRDRDAGKVNKHEVKLEDVKSESRKSCERLTSTVPLDARLPRTTDKETPAECELNAVSASSPSKPSSLDQIITTTPNSTSCTTADPSVACLSSTVICPTSTEQPLQLQAGDKRRASGAPLAAKRRRDSASQPKTLDNCIDKSFSGLGDHVDVRVGDKVSVLYKVNQKKEKVIYEAKVLQVDENATVKRYFIHYLNWNKRYDEWVDRCRVVTNHSWTVQITRGRRGKRPLDKVVSVFGSKSAATAPRRSAHSITIAEQNQSPAHYSVNLDQEHSPGDSEEVEKQDRSCIDSVLVTERCRSPGDSVSVAEQELSPGSSVLHMNDDASTRAGSEEDTAIKSEHETRSKIERSDAEACTSDSSVDSVTSPARLRRAVQPCSSGGECPRGSESPTVAEPDSTSDLPDKLSGDVYEFTDENDETLERGPVPEPVLAPRGATPGARKRRPLSSAHALWVSTCSVGESGELDAVPMKVRRQSSQETAGSRNYFAGLPASPQPADDLTCCETMIPGSPESAPSPGPSGDDGCWHRSTAADRNPAKSSPSMGVGDLTTGPFPYSGDRVLPRPAIDTVSTAAVTSLVCGDVGAFSSESAATVISTCSSPSQTACARSVSSSPPHSSDLAALVVSSPSACFPTEPGSPDVRQSNGGVDVGHCLPDTADVSPYKHSVSGKRRSRRCHLTAARLLASASPRSESALTSSGDSAGALDCAYPVEEGERSRLSLDDDSRFNFLLTFDDDTDGQSRVNLLTEQIDKLRDRYGSLKSQLTRLRRRIKKLKKKHKDGPGDCISSSAPEGVRKLRPSFVAQ